VAGARLAAGAGARAARAVSGARRGRGRPRRASDQVASARGAGRSPRPPSEQVVYGRNPVREALRGRRTVRRAWATARAAREPWLAGVSLELVDDAAALERRCGSPDHQGVCAAVAPYPYADPDALLTGPAPLVLALDGIQDPGNLGAICRTAEAAGASGVVIPERRAAAVTPAVCKASAGAVEHLQIARVRNLADFLLAAKAAGCWCYGADATARRRYDEVDYTGGVVVVIGGEGRGLRPRVAATCDELVALPMRGRVGSLNASAAAAALVYGALARRG
jgi:23S rRNA (guanosine2251-2'-O)-methyltransferase